MHDPVFGISFVHQKGGTGKTTSCLNVAGWLVKMKKKVLVIDLDPQGNATGGLGIERSTIEGSIYDVLLGQKSILEVILETSSGVNLAPASPDLLAVETHGDGMAEKMGAFRRGCREIQGHFDYVLVDTPPGSSLLMMMGIAAYGNIIIPTETGVFAFEALSTFKSLIVEMNKEAGMEVNLLMMLLRRASRAALNDHQTRRSKQWIKDFLVENSMPQVRVLRIPFSRRINEAQVKGLPLSHYAPHSGAARAFRKIAMRIIDGAQPISPRAEYHANRTREIRRENGG
jgi:chromosome partitioning protein